MAADFRPGSSEEFRHEIATHKSVASRSSPELAQPEIQLFHASENHLVGGFNQPLWKNDGVKVTWDDG